MNKRGSSGDKFIERRICIGFLISTEYIKAVVDLYDPQYIEVDEALMLIDWSLKYYEKYGEAPKENIQPIYYNNAPKLEKGQAEFIEIVLESMSDEIERESLNTKYLIDETGRYFKKRKLEIYIQTIRDEINDGEIDKAEYEAENFKSIAISENKGITPFTDADVIREAFEKDVEPMVEMGGQIGKTMDSSLTRDSFVALLGRSKAGKTWWLSEIVKRAHKSKRNVVFFQAGDMSQSQQLRRIGVGLAKKSNRKKYCGGLYVPVLDCIHNQNDSCDLQIRDCDFGPLDGYKPDAINKLRMIEYIDLIKKHPDYVPCKSCRNERRTQFEGTVWYKYRPPVKPLTWKEALKKGEKFNRRYGQRYRLFTYPNKTLTLSIIRRKFDSLLKENFVPDVIVIDYMDIMALDKWMPKDFRHGQDALWAGVRGLASELNILIVAATQADSSSFSAKTLTSSNFSEDRRKLDHVTAMFGLNTTDFEKAKGIQRINEIVIRDDDFSPANQVVVLQCLQIGCPLIDSYRHKLYNT